MTGAISGAHLGIGGLPAELAQVVNDNGAWGYYDLVRLAEQCHAVAINCVAQDHPPKSSYSG
jgi:hypothetical protein